MEKHDDDDDDGDGEMKSDPSGWTAPCADQLPPPPPDWTPSRPPPFPKVSLPPLSLVVNPPLHSSPIRACSSTHANATQANTPHSTFQAPVTGQSCCFSVAKEVGRLVSVRPAMAEEARGRAVNPACPNAENPFHRCAAYCPVAAPPAGSKAQNGTARGGGDGEAGGRQRQAVNPDCPNADNPFHRCAEYCPVAAPAAASKPPPARAAQNGNPRGDGEVAEAGAGGRQRQAVNPDCPNAVNPFHRCAEYCPVPAPAPAAAVKTFPLPPGPGRELAQNGRTHSDGDLKPRERRRDRAGGSGGLPLYVFLREGSDGEGKKVDPRCPNAGNPFHVCTDHCLPKIVDAGRSSEGGKSPISLFSRHSRRSSSSSEDGSVKSKSSKGSKKGDSKCPNAGNPFHECGEHCTAKIKEVEKQKKTEKQSPRKKGGKDLAVVQNWKVDPRCPNAGNPFHICAQYCFDYLNEAAPAAPSKPDSRKGKAVMKAEPTGEINPECANASNPYHKCGEHCKRSGNR